MVLCFLRVTEATMAPSDDNEPPPNYQDAISDYEYPSARPNGSLTGDAHRSLRQYTQCFDDQKSGSLNAPSNELWQRSEEGVTALQVTCPGNDRGGSESILPREKDEKSLDTHQEILSVSLCR